MQASLEHPSRLSPADQIEANWYAVYTRSRHEKSVELMLRRQRLETYLPVKSAWSPRRDRRVTLEVPALPGYLFVRCHLWGEVRARIKKTPGVIRVVESAGSPCAIPGREIESLRLVLERSGHVEAHTGLKVGDPVEVVRGPLVGARGYLERIASGRHRLVVRIHFVSRAVAVEIHPADLAACA
jgi:transcription antitermination factor NusG